MSKTVNIQGHDIRFEISGSGYPLCFVHGFGEDRSVWDAFIKPFEKEYLVIRPDIPGFGESPPWKGISIDNMAEAINAILEDLEIEKCILIGHSMGGYASLGFAQMFGEKLDGLGLFHSHPFADSEEKKKGRKQGIEFLERNGAEPFVKQLVPKLFGKKARDKFKDLIQIMIKRGIDAGPEGLINSLKAMSKRPDRSKVLTEIMVPVLFIVGKEDELVPWEYSLNQTPLPAVASIHILENIGHAGMFEAKEVTQKVVSDFVKFCLAKR